MRSIGVLLASAAALMLALPHPAGGADVPRSGLAQTNGTVSVGAPAPPLTGTDIAGRAITAAMFTGRPVLVDFGSIFCISCQQIMKEFVRLERDYRATDLALVMVTDSIASPAVMTNAFAGIGASYTVIRDEGSRLFDSYGVKLIPFQVLIDRQGIVRKIHTGFDPEWEAVVGLQEFAGPSRAAGAR